MIFLRTMWFHFKRVIVNPGFIVVSVLIPLVMLGGMYYLTSSSPASIMSEDVVIINHSDKIAAEVIPALDEHTQSLFVDDRAEAMADLEQVNLSMVYEIPADFPSEPIQVYSINGQNRDLLLEAELSNTLLEQLEQTALAEAGIQIEAVEVAQPQVTLLTEQIGDGLLLIVFMVCFFLMYSISVMTTDLNTFRKTQVLKRSITANSHSGVVLGGLLAGYGLALVIAASFTIGTLCLITREPLTHIGLILSLVTALTIYALGLGLLLFRIIKNEQIIVLFSILVPMIFVGLAVFTDPSTLIGKINYISPFYWLLESLDTGIFFPNVLVIVLYGLVLFTAGSFKVEHLIAK